MGKRDIGLKSYLGNAARYADLWNGAVFQGKQVIRPEVLQEISPVRSKADEKAILEKTGDLVMKQSYDGQKFLILALENQDKIDYGMPVRIMLQEALEYDWQIKEIMRKNERAYQAMRVEHTDKTKTVVYQDSGEYLYKVKKEDRLYPIMTLIVYWGEDAWGGAKSLHEMIDFGSADALMGEQLKRMIPEYPLHLLDLTNFNHFEYFRTELRPLLEMFQRRNRKEDFMEYIKRNEGNWAMDDESWYMLGQLTDSKDIRNLIKEKRQSRRRDKGMCKAIEDMKNDARAEGKAECIIDLLGEYGIVSEELKSKIFKQTDLQILSEWFKLAVHTRSVNEFVKAIN